MILRIKTSLTRVELDVARKSGRIVVGLRATRGDRISDDQWNLALDEVVKPDLPGSVSAERLLVSCIGKDGDEVDFARQTAGAGNDELRATYEFADTPAPGTVRILWRRAGIEELTIEA